MVWKFRSIKVVSTIFYQIIIFSPHDSPSKTENVFLFHLKSFFHCQDIQVFVFSSSFPLSRFASKGQMEME